MLKLGLFKKLNICRQSNEHQLLLLLMDFRDIRFNLFEIFQDKDGGDEWQFKLLVKRAVKSNNGAADIIIDERAKRDFHSPSCSLYNNI
jgi:hypothetical protein